MLHRTVEGHLGSHLDPSLTLRSDAGNSDLPFAENFGTSVVRSFVTSMTGALFFASASTSNAIRIDSNEAESTARWIAVFPSPRSR
jgi:hypothetical protein